MAGNLGDRSAIFPMTLNSPLQDGLLFSAYYPEDRDSAELYANIRLALVEVLGGDPSIVTIKYAVVQSTLVNAQIESVALDTLIRGVADVFFSFDKNVTLFMIDGLSNYRRIKSNTGMN